MLTDAVCRFGADRAEKFAVTEVDNADRTKETSDLYDIEVRLSESPLHILLLSPIQTLPNLIVYSFSVLL